MYAHYRVLGPLGFPLPCGGATVYYEIETDPNLIGNRGLGKEDDYFITMTARASVCSAKDHFFYARGRAIAEGRYKGKIVNGPDGPALFRGYHTISSEDSRRSDIHDLLDSYVRELTKNSKQIGMLSRYSRTQGRPI